jgi:putative pyruvate formate lyase activating enzyme
MLDLQRLGCHNVNLVSPSHVVPQILAATQVAARAGLRLPLVYNTGGYDSLETLALLDGVVDIYMPDAKYADAEVGARYSGVPDYPAVNQAALREIYRQVGDLAWDKQGIARRGLLVRHLVLPEGLAGSAAVIAFLADLSPHTAVNVMGQYRPCHEAYDLPPLDRRVSQIEVDEARRMARDAGLRLL